MKKVLFGLVAFISLSLVLSSCKKHEEHEGTVNYQTIEIVLDMNKSYQYSFGAIDPKDQAVITKQSNAFLVSEVDKSGETILFNYTPNTNFVGTDEVQVTIGEEEHEHHHKQGPHHPNPLKFLKHKKHHGCEKHDDDDKTVYIFKFTVNNVGVPIINESATETHK